MKKTILIILVFIFFCFGLFRAGIYILNSKIADKKNIIYTNISEIYAKNKSSNMLVKDLDLNGRYLNIDSLNDFINEDIKPKQQLSIDYVEREYHINKGIINMLNDTLLGDNDKNRVKNNIVELNKLIENYNYSVKDYNSFIRSFPIYFYTYKKYKTEEYFELIYGTENINPKYKYVETLESMLE